MTSVKGFTLIEILVTVAIIGILTAIAVPVYKDYVTRSKLSEAYAVLAGQRVKMEQFYQDLRTYTGACVAGTVAPPVTGQYFTYDCPTGIADQTYTITATGIAAQDTSGFSFRIDQSNNRTTVSVPAGWTNPNTCWTRTKDGKC